MAMSDCSSCWDTPCTCANGKGYRHLSIRELEDIQRGIALVLDDKRKRGVDPNSREFRSLTLTQDKQGG